MRVRPVVFIGSSSEGGLVAEAIQTSLNGSEVEAVLWTALFEPGYLTIEALDQKADDFDFAVFVFSSDEVLESRGTRGPAPRDNILLELGLFVGRTGGESGSSTPFGPVTDRSCRAISLARRVSSTRAQVRSAQTGSCEVISTPAQAYRRTRAEKPCTRASGHPLRFRLPRGGSADRARMGRRSRRPRRSASCSRRALRSTFRPMPRHARSRQGIYGL